MRIALWLKKAALKEDNIFPMSLATLTKLA